MALQVKTKDFIFSTKHISN